MLFQMKQRVLCFGDDYTIHNERGNDMYFIDGKVFSLGDSLSFQDM